MDVADNVYFTDAAANTLQVQVSALVPTNPITVGSTAGQGTLAVLPTTQVLTGLFAPTSDQSWLKIGTADNGVISYSYTARPTAAARTAHITVLGQSITVTQETAQRITFAKPAAVTYGVKPITLHASASSKLPVTLTVISGPGTISGDQLTVTGAGSIVIEAYQAGNGTYAPVAVTQTLTVNKAALIVTATNTTWTKGQSGQSLAGFTITGFVDGDTEATVFGAEAALVTCPTVNASNPKAGSYVINIAQGTLLTAANYTLTFRKGKLTVR